jgi:hypothetical protein
VRRFRWPTIMLRAIIFGIALAFKFNVLAVASWIQVGKSVVTNLFSPGLIWKLWNRWSYLRGLEGTPFGWTMKFLVELLFWSLASGAARSDCFAF